MFGKKFNERYIGLNPNPVDWLLPIIIEGKISVKKKTIKFVMSIAYVIIHFFKINTARVAIMVRITRRDIQCIGKKIISI